MRRSIRAICSAPAKPSSLGSIVRVTMARDSFRPPRERVFSRTGGKVRRQEVLGGLEQGGLGIPADQDKIGALVIEDLMHGFVLDGTAAARRPNWPHVPQFSESRGRWRFSGASVFSSGSTSGRRPAPHRSE